MLTCRFGDPIRNLAQVREIVGSWSRDYDIARPHQALGYMTARRPRPIEFKLVG